MWQPQFNPATDLFGLTWQHEMRFGELFYRLRAVSGVQRSYRRRPTHFVIQIEVQWGYDDPFRRLDTPISDRLPTKTYVMTGAADTKPRFELIEPVKVASQWGGFDVKETAEMRAGLRLKEKLDHGWTHMLASGSQRYFRGVPDRLMNQMVFNKMADLQWPTAPRNTDRIAA